MFLVLCLEALEVLSAEGETLPWVILLQPEHKHTGTVHTAVKSRN